MAALDIFDLVLHSAKLAVLPIVLWFKNVNLIIKLIIMATYEFAKCEMAVNASCAKCNQTP